MNIVEFKTYLTELIDEAYQTAESEGSDEIMFPFVVTLREHQIEFRPLGAKPSRDYHSLRSSLLKT